MSINVPIRPQAVKPTNGEAMASTLLREWERDTSSASVDHAAGRHVGLDGDDVGCGLCGAICGDMPERMLGETHSDYAQRSTPAVRAAFLERNIAEVAAIMRMRAEIVEFELSRRP
jgi:hypothetical protein